MKAFQVQTSSLQSINVRLTSGRGAYALVGTWTLDEDTANFCSLPVSEIQPDLAIVVEDNQYLIHPEDYDEVKRMLQRADSATVETEITLIGSAGRLFVLFLTGHFSEMNSAGVTLSFGEDGGIDWQRIQEEVNLNKLMMESAIQSDIIALSVLKPVLGEGGELADFKWVLANKLLRALAGGRDVIGKRYTDIFPGASSDGTLDILKEVFQSGDHRENHVYYRDNNVRAWVRQVFVKSQGFVIVSAEDVTLKRKADLELRKNFQILQQIEEIAATGSWEFDLRNGSFFWSAGMYRLFNLPTTTSVTPEIYVDFAVEEDKAVAERVVRLIRDGEESFVESLRITAAGQEKTVKIKGFVQKTENRKASRVLGVDVDVTVLLESEQAIREQSYLKEMNTKLRQMDEAKNNFLSSVSHEFRTPITLMLGPLNDLLTSPQTELSDSVIQTLEMVRRNARRLQKLVNNLLDFARMEAGQLETYFEPTRLGAFTSEIASHFQPLIQQAGLKFIFKSDEDTEPVYVNRDMWEKIVLNLVSNAFKFTHQGKIQVTVQFQKNRVLFAVQDTGVGICEKDIPRIFERFARVEGRKGRNYEGSGIGLALVKEMVTAHGGTIKVKSDEGKGSVFSVYLPRGKAHLPARSVFENPSEGRASHLTEAFREEVTTWESGQMALNLPHGESGRSLVMVVDDNADMRRYISSILRPTFKVVEAENGAVALGLLTSGQAPDLILSDVMMPELNGFGMTEAIKGHPDLNNIPVVLLSAFADSENIRHGLATGAEDYLRKPFSSVELITLVQARLNQAKKRSTHHHHMKTKAAELEASIAERSRQIEDNKATLAQQNELLLKNNTELKILNDQLATFAFIASHDLREPLRKISLFSKMVLDREKAAISDKASVYISKILTSVERMNGLFDDVLEFARLSSSEPQEFVEMNVQHALHPVFKILGGEIGESGAVIHCETTHNIKAVPRQFELLLQSLISNAIKFRTPSVAPRITVSEKWLAGKDIKEGKPDHDTLYYCLEVSDNGIGFKPEHRHRIFQLFQRLHTAAEYKGSGLGLSLCKKIMENHRGFISAASEPGQGSRFMCYFPQNDGQLR
jgi:signal transduction histidine kinase